VPAGRVARWAARFGNARALAVAADRRDAAEAAERARARVARARARSSAPWSAFRAETHEQLCRRRTTV
jgi:hypothetical protein